MGNEGDVNGVPRNQAQLFVHLGVMPMLRHLVGFEGLADLTEVGGQTQTATSAADTGFRIGHQIDRGYEPVPDQRYQGQQNTGRVTAGVADQPG